MNNFIVTANGFVKEKIRLEPFSSGEVKIIYTDKLREAKRFLTSGKAGRFMENNSLQGFVYNPWKEEPLGELYQVSKKIKYDEKTHHPIMEYYFPEEVYMAHETDGYFLTHKTSVRSKFLTFDEAKKVALEKNELIISQLQSAMETLNNIKNGDDL